MIIEGKGEWSYLMSVGMLLRASSSALKTAAFIQRSACSSSTFFSDFNIISDASEFCKKRTRKRENKERRKKMKKQERK
jgi:hypothetical protein